jgi:hypothetical protein
LATDDLIWVAAGYVLLTIAIFAIEVKRTRSCGPDVLTLFMALFVLQCCLPGIVIFGCLPITGVYQPTGNPVFDRIFATMDYSSALLTLAMTAWFAILIYIFMALGAVVIRRIFGSGDNAWIMLRGAPARLVMVLLVGLALTMVSFWSMGDTLVARYASLIELSAGSTEVLGSSLNNFAFPLTHSWLWLSVVALFVLFERRGRDLAWYFCLTGTLLLVALAVSRRAIFIPIFLAYFTSVLFDGRWRLKFVLAGAIPLVLWIAFGKELLAAIAFGGSAQEILGRYDSLAEGALRTASEVGITMVESLGTLNLVHIPMRFGVDHVLSIMRGAPIGWFLHWLGQDSALPARVVRLSTAAFATPYDQDVPPGLFGQMWLDFRLGGPIVWAFGLAMQLSLVQGIFGSIVRTREAIAALVLATFVIALPLNSGSYDFSFGADIVVVALSLLFSFKMVRIRFRMEACA